MTTLPVAEARSHFSRLVEQASTTHERFEITRNGSRAAVLLGAEDYDAMLETLAILSELELVKEIGQGLKDLESGDTFTVEQVRADMRTAAPKG
ncbi:type II toxin-antitoxin system Phd/YefM family antitoxin [Pseudarthrobacter sp. H2]|uniref:type II toxin-antitoxin system Phd/YefM family antitoxin n=1 Tax=Pseudarthrobacter sp. H2 TaxID=3418415 RepID=UPI003CFB26E3